MTIMLASHASSRRRQAIGAEEVLMLRSVGIGLTIRVAATMVRDEDRGYELEFTGEAQGFAVAVNERIRRRWI